MWRRLVIAARPAGAIDYSTILRSPGSTLKPFLYARALDRGLIAPQDVLADLPQGASGIANADHDFLGPLLPRQALANSRNVPAANLLHRIGLNDGFDFLHALHLHDLPGPAERYGLAMAIGALPTSLERLMRAYATLAEDGADADLAWFAGANPETRQRVSVDSARLIGRFLSDPLARLPSFPRYGASEFPFAVALKTGTSQGYRDAWTIEWSRDYLVGVWFGRADAGTMSALSGGRAAARLAQAVMLRLHGVGRGDLVAGDFAAPPGREEAEICTRTGATASTACPEQLAEWIRPGPEQPVRNRRRRPGFRSCSLIRTRMSGATPTRRPRSTGWCCAHPWNPRRPRSSGCWTANRSPWQRRTRRLLDDDPRPPSLPDPPAAPGRCVQGGVGGRRVAVAEQAPNSARRWCVRRYAIDSSRYPPPKARRSVAKCRMATAIAHNPADLFALQIAVDAGHPGVRPR